MGLEGVMPSCCLHLRRLKLEPLHALRELFLVVCEPNIFNNSTICTTMVATNNLLQQFQIHIRWNKEHTIDAYFISNNYKK